MIITGPQTKINPAEIPPERLAGNTSLSEQQKIAEASRQFEAILLRQILAASQKTVIPSKFADNSTASGIYHDLVTGQLADQISKSGTFGLAKTFEHQLSRPPHLPVEGEHSPAKKLSKHTP
jgi:flagellar protein FlgJ